MIPHFNIAKNTFYQAASRLTCSFLGFLSFFLIARSFGPAGYGDFTKITAYVGIFWLVIDFGFNAIYLREDQELKYFKNLFLIRVILAFFLIILTNTVVLFLPQNNILGTGFPEKIKLGIFIYSLTILAQAVSISNNVIFQKNLKYVFSLIANIAGSFTTFLLVLFFVLKQSSLDYILGAYVLGFFLANIISIILTKAKFVSTVLDFTFAKKIILQSMPIGLMLIFNLIYFRIDMVLLSIYKSPTDVGIYGFSYKFFDFLIALPLFLSNALYPTLIEQTKNYRTFSLIIKKYTWLLLLFSLILGIVCFAFAPLVTIVKSDYLASVLPFRILLISLPFFFMTCLLQWGLIALKDQKFLMPVYLMATIINISLNFIFIPIGSYIACAIITVVCEAAVFAVLLARTMIIHKKYSK